MNELAFTGGMLAGHDAATVLSAVRQLCWEAAAILKAYARGETPPFGYPPILSVDDDPKGPVTAADLAVNEHLIKGLQNAFPAASWAILSEETTGQWPADQAIANDWLWILDPLDGTKDFLQGTGEYAVHLALVHQQRPALGVVLLPELDELWFGWIDPSGMQPPAAWKEAPDGERHPPSLSRRTALSSLIPVTSRSHRDNRHEQLMATLPITSGIARGSVGGKVASILRGETDLYISLSGKTAPKDWDMAAPEAVLLAAGGAFTHADGQPLLYNTGDFRQAGCLIASHGPAHKVLCDAAAAAMARIDPEAAL